MRFIFFLPFILLLVWVYSAMFESLNIKTKFFKPLRIISGALAATGLILIIVAAIGGYHL